MSILVVGSPVHMWRGIRKFQIAYLISWGAGLYICSAAKYIRLLYLNRFKSILRISEKYSLRGMCCELCCRDLHCLRYRHTWVAWHHPFATCMWKMHIVQSLVGSKKHFSSLASTCWPLAVQVWRLPCHHMVLINLMKETPKKQCKCQASSMVSC